MHHTRYSLMKHCIICVEATQITQGFIKEYLVDIPKANKHKINGYKLLKENYVKEIKSNSKGTKVLFIMKCHVFACHVFASVKTNKYSL